MRGKKVKQKPLSNVEVRKRNSINSQELDTNKTGTLEAEELFEVAGESLQGMLRIQNEGEDPYFEPKVGPAEMRRFMAIFDQDGNGSLDKNEFADFVKFSICRSWIEVRLVLRC